MISFNARDCNIKELTKEEVGKFLEDNHQQGKANYIISYGLINNNNELLQLITFGRPRFDKSYSWEIIRDCTKKDYIINGGTSKIWKHFIKNNTVRSCICYSYPHDKENLYTNKYVDYCGFVNIKKAKPAKKVYFEGVWNDKVKRIDKSILEVHGVDRLLKGDFGHDRTNEQILLDLGFKKKIEDGYEPQVDSYFPNGIVYKITDLDTGKFYIGETIKEKEFYEEKYNGSGTSSWTEYYEKYKDIHIFKREILKDNFKTPKDLYSYEVKEIRKYCIKLPNGNYKVDESTGCMNRKTQPQGDMPVCPECGALLYKHKKSCSKYNRKPCSKCGSIAGHKKTCPDAKRCPECGSTTNHKKNCSQYTNPERCPECNSPCGHKKTCSHYKKPNSCPECGVIIGHKKTCSHYTKQAPCSECGKTHGHHESWCSNYKDNSCKECGSKTRHKAWCSKNIKREKIICSECGGKDGKHKSSCSKKKAVPPCEECGAKIGHKKFCSKYYKNN